MKYRLKKLYPMYISSTKIDMKIGDAVEWDIVRNAYLHLPLIVKFY